MKDEINLGPGSYEINKTTLLLNWNYGNSLKSKNNKDHQKNWNSIGPGNYDPDFKIVKWRP